MFSDLSCDTPSCDALPFNTQLREDTPAPLDFDDLLDIAREFEFTRTITHIWPCDEPSSCPETGLNDILAAIIPSPDVEECPSLQLGSASSIPLEHAHLEKADVQRSVPVHPAPDENASVFKSSVLLPKNDDQVRSEAVYPITSTLRGWSPPKGFQFLDLDDSLMLPQSATDAWLSPWPTPFLAPPYAQSAENINQSSAIFRVIGDTEPEKGSNSTYISILSGAGDDPRRDSAVHFVAPPVSDANLEPGQARPTSPVNPNVPPQMVITPLTKITKYRIQLPSVPTTATKYARAPRGGIPPHIARTVAKASFLRIERERKVMQDAFSNTNAGEGKKPSVLRRTVNAVGEGKGKNQFDSRGSNEKKGRAVKRAKV